MLTADAFIAGISHYKAVAAGDPAMEAKGFPGNGVESFLQSCTGTGRKCKLQMTGITDIKFTGVFLGEFKAEFDCVTHIGNIITADHDIVAVTAPALGISWKFYGQDFCIGCFTASSIAVICPAAPVRELKSPRV